MANEDLNRMFQWAVDTCNAGNVGYSNKYRNGSIDPDRGCVCYDCSSFVWWALKNGGWQNIGSSANSPGFYARPNAREAFMCPQLLSWGFTEYTFGSVPTLPGDILWKATSSEHGHTEIVYEGSPAGQREVRTMGAHDANRPLADQVSILAVPTDKSWQKIYRWGSGGATGYGLSKYVIAALCGNFYGESGINPERWEQPSGEGYGIAQWSFTRKTALFNWLDANGYSRTDGNAQCEYVTIEQHWNVNKDPHGYTSAQDFLASTSTNVDDLVESWYYAWEEPPATDTSLQKRKDYANYVLTYMVEHFNDPNITAWIHQPEALSYAQTLNNAVMVYRYYSAGGGGGGGDRTRKKMPIWMMLRPWWKLI